MEKINIMPEISSILEKFGENIDNLVSFDINTHDIHTLEITLIKKIRANMTKAEHKQNQMRKQFKEE